MGGVQQQVDKQLHQLRLVRPDPRRIRQLDLQRRAMCHFLADQSEGCGACIVDAHLSSNSLLVAFRESLKLFRDSSDALSSSVSLGELAALFFVQVIAAPENEFDVAHDIGQRVVDLVTNTRRQQTHRRQPVGAQQANVVCLLLPVLLRCNQCLNSCASGPLIDRCNSDQNQRDQNDADLVAASRLR